MTTEERIRTYKKAREKTLLLVDNLANRLGQVNVEDTDVVFELSRKLTCIVSADEILEDYLEVLEYEVRIKEENKPEILHTGQPTEAGCDDADCPVPGGNCGD